MRELSAEQEMALLRDQIARICEAGCPETYRLPERAWRLVHQALSEATEARVTENRAPPVSRFAAATLPATEG
jgi:hypothetical protein